MKRLRAQRDPRNKYARWILELEPLNYEIQYRRGQANGAADYLSRTPCEVDSVVDEEEYFERNIFLIEQEISMVREEIKRGKLQDQSIKNAVRQLKEQENIVSGPFRRQEGMRVESEGRLFRNRPLVIPHKLKGDITMMVHRVAHPGIEKTYAYLQARFYWTGMKKDVEECCKACMVCLENKRVVKRKEPLKPIVGDVLEPRRMIAADIAVLPWSADGYRYILIIVDLF